MVLPPPPVRKQQPKTKTRPDNDDGNEGERKRRQLYLADAPREARAARRQVVRDQQEALTEAEVGAAIAARVQGSGDATVRDQES